MLQWKKPSFHTCRKAISGAAHHPNLHFLSMNAVTGISMAFLAFLRCKPIQTEAKHPNRRFLSMPIVNCVEGERR